MWKILLLDFQNLIISTIVSFNQTHQIICISSDFPVVEATNNDVLEVHEIYVSKFPPSTSCEDIIQLITKKLLLNSGVYKVIKLVRRNLNMNNLSFVSFKISTLNKHVYDLIINSDIWSPDHSAVKFVSKIKIKPISGAQKQNKKPNNKIANFKNKKT